MLLLLLFKTTFFFFFFRVGGKHVLITKLYTKNFMRSVENNVWPTLQSAAVRNDNTSIITLIFTGRGIVLGTGSNDAFVITLEDCRLCSLNWHEPKKIILHPTHVERIEGKYSKRRRSIVVIDEVIFISWFLF